jgi:hypothetical protein
MPVDFRLIHHCHLFVGVFRNAAPKCVSEELHGEVDELVLSR